MATEPKSTTTAGTGSESASTDRATTSSSRTNGGRSDDRVGERAGRVAEQARESAQGATAAVGQLVRRGQDDALRAARLWTELLTRSNPLTLLTGRSDETGPDAAGSGTGAEVAAGFPAAAWAEGAFELVKTTLATQRRFVDQVLSAQRQLVAQFLDAGASIATATQDEVARSSVPNLNDARTTRR